MTTWPLIETTVQSASAHAEIVDQIYAGRALGCIVRGLVTLEAATAAIARLHDAPRESIGGDGDAYVHGCMLAPTVRRPQGPELDEYLASAAAWHAPSIFGDDVMANIHGVMSAIANHKRVRVPLAPDGRSYASATVRVFPDAAEVPIHCDTYRVMPGHQHLSTLTDARTQLSWYLPLSVPREGGQLAIYEARHGEPSPKLEHPELYTIGVGDLVVFDAGRYYHAITRIAGEPRRTLAGFARLSADGTCVYAWG